APSGSPSHGRAPVTLPPSSTGKSRAFHRQRSRSGTPSQTSSGPTPSSRSQPESGSPSNVAPSPGGRRASSTAPTPPCASPPRPPPPPAERLLVAPPAGRDPQLPFRRVQA